MTFPYKLIDLTQMLDIGIPTWNGGCGFNYELHIDYADCKYVTKFSCGNMDLAGRPNQSLDF